MLYLPSFLCLVLLVYGQSPNLPGGYPLAVKTPYLHSWISNNNQTAPEQIWPVLFTHTKVSHDYFTKSPKLHVVGKNLGWNGMIRVDGQAYQWLGDSFEANFSTTVALGGTITPTKTIFTIHAGPVRFNATFFSPIEPNNYTRQSIPFTYLFVDAFMADDAGPHTIQLYSDISAEWVTSKLTTPVIWDTSNSTNIVYHHVQSKDPQSMVDRDDSAEDSTGYYATHQESCVLANLTYLPDKFLQRSGLTWQTGVDVDCRAMFALNGSLTNSADTVFRAVYDRWPVFSFAIDLGPVTTNNQPDPVVWALGLVRNPLVNYATDSGIQPRTAYYWSSYKDIDSVISDFLGDFEGARSRGQTFDHGITSAASAISSEYEAILSLVTRQVFASMDITIPTSEGVQPSASDVKIFMKDISVSRRANPVEVIYAALPALVYFNSSLLHDLLVPLLEFQSSSSYPNPYASPDLGTTYPTISGNTSATETLAIEHCGNMLIMAYAHAAKSSDNSLISKYHSLLQKWGDYLAQHSLHPNNAVSADGFGYPDMSNLALKGILGIYSMGKIDEALHSSNTTFRDKASELIADWAQLAASGTHIQAQYGQPSTWGLMYNLFPAVWLQTGLIDDDMLKREAQFYSSNAPSGNQSYSLDSQSGNGLAYPHWTLMTAAIIPSGFASVRDNLITSTYLQAYNVSQQYPLPMRYAASTGVTNLRSTGSAAQGAAFGILAMGTQGTRGGTEAPKNTQSGKIVGSVIGGLAFLLVVSSAIFFWRRHKTRTRVVVNPFDDHNAESYPFSYENVPPSRQVPAPYPERQGHKRLYSDSGGGCHPITITTSVIPGGLPLSRKQREALERVSNSELAASNSTNTNSGAGSGGDENLVANDTLRAEVEELRREMEAIRDLAQPPPGYH